MFWSETFWPTIGGAELLASDLLPALVARGHELLVVTRGPSTGPPARSYLSDVPVHNIELPVGGPSLDPDLLFTARQEISRLKRTFQPDLVHVWHLGLSALLHWQTRRVHDAPTLVTLHNELDPRRFGPRSAALAIVAQADWLAACSDSVLAGLHRLVPAVTTRSSAIPNAIPPLDRLPTPLPWTPPRLLGLGRLVRQKGFDLALAALALLEPGVQFTLAGDGPECEALQRQVIELGLAERVELLGWVDPARVPTLINTATALVIPSRWEGLPLVALQAAQLARPLVGTGVGGLGQVLVDGQTGLRVPVDDHQALAAALRRLLANPALAVSLGRAARQHVERSFDWGGYVAAYDGLYRRLGPQPGPHLGGA
jgi:glycogen synthase